MVIVRKTRLLSALAVVSLAAAFVTFDIGWKYQQMLALMMCVAVTVLSMLILVPLANKIWVLVEGEARRLWSSS